MNRRLLHVMQSNSSHILSPILSFFWRRLRDRVEENLLRVCVVSSGEEEREGEGEKERKKGPSVLIFAFGRSFFCSFTLCSILCNFIYPMSRACARKERTRERDYVIPRKGLHSLYYERCPFWLVVSLLFMYKYICVCASIYPYVEKESEAS